MKDDSAIGYPVTECGHERQHAQGAEFGRSTVLSPRCHQSCSAKRTFVDLFGIAKRTRLTQYQLPGRFQHDQTKRLSRTYITGVYAALCLMLLWCLVVPGCVVKSDEALCPGLNVSIHSLDKEDAETACKGAADAVAFLAALGLDTTAPVSVRILDRLPEGIAPPAALGCEVRAEQRVYMLAFAACPKQGFAPDLPIDRALYRSLIAHEVAHHIAAANFKVEKPSVVAHEYIAYVTMFATMGPDQRDEILAHFPGEGWDNERGFNVSVYMMAPHFFGAQAYRHFMRLEDRQAFLERVLSGSALADDNQR